MTNKLDIKDALFAVPDFGHGGTYNTSINNNFASGPLLRQAILSGPALLEIVLSGKSATPHCQLLRFIEDLKGQVIYKCFNPEASSDSKDPVIVHVLWKHTHAQITVNSIGFISSHVSSNDEEEFYRVADALKKITLSTKEETVGMIMMNGTEPYINTIPKVSVDLIRYNYSDEVLQGVDHVLEDLNTTNPCGRLVIIDGEPGVGKTFLLRSLFGLTENSRYILLSTNQLEQITNPSLARVLVDQHNSIESLENAGGNIVLVIEDADQYLVTREEGNSSAISAILNLSDGILGAAFDLRIIATTNAGHIKNSKDIDPAVTRNGRLCQRIEVTPLPPEHANVRFQQLSNTKKTPFTKPTSLADIYKLAHSNGESQLNSAFKPTNTLGFGK